MPTTAHVETSSFDSGHCCYSVSPAVYTWVTYNRGDLAPGRETQNYWMVQVLHPVKKYAEVEVVPPQADPREPEQQAEPQHDP